MSRLKRYKLSMTLFVLSGLTIVLLALLTSPIHQISWAIVFFVALLFMFISFGHILVERVVGQVSSRSRYRIFVISIFLLVAIMFRSAQSLRLPDLIVILSVTVLLIFYGNRRST
jgi:hypothetical protein